MIEKTDQRIAMEKAWSTPSYSRDEMYSAMCIWEEICNPQLDGKPWEEALNHFGYGEMRTMVINHLAGPCNKAWERANEEHDRLWLEYSQKREDAWRSRPSAALSSDPSSAQPTSSEWEAFRVQYAKDHEPEPIDPGSFDWEFVPFWLRTCVDWSDLDKPRVRGAKPEEGLTNNQ